MPHTTFNPDNPSLDAVDGILNTANEIPLSPMPTPAPNLDNSVGINIGVDHIWASTYTKKLKKISLEQVKNICAGCGKNVTVDGNIYQNIFPYGNGQVINEKNEVEWVCSNCLSKFIQCVDCQRYQKPEKLQLNRCPSCIEAAPRKYIRNYSFKVENDLRMRGEKPKDEIYYGVELELESDNLGLDVLIVNDLIKEFACLKKDSSIKKGFEIVTTPATIDEHLYMWDEFFEKLPKTCNPLQSCGMHVHASRNRMTELQIGKILVFLHAKENHEFIKLIAGRDSSFHNDFSKPKKFGDGRKVVDRHTALNLNNDQTIEFRIFWSTRDKRIFLKNIEFVKALIKFSDWAMKSIKEVSHFKNFVAFVREQRKEYEYLSLFFETPSMRKLLGEE